MQCILQCSKSDICSIAVVDSLICNMYTQNELKDLNMIDSLNSTIFIKNELKNSNQIDSLDSTIYINKSNDSISQYLIHYWPFNGNYLDVITNKSLYNLNKASLTTDRFGRNSSSLKLNYGNLQAQDGIYFYGDFTLTTWVKMYALNATVRFFKMIAQSGTSLLFCLTFSANTGPFYAFSNGNQAANTSLTIGKWQHLAYTIKGTTLSIYIDGLCVYTGFTSQISPQVFNSVYFGYPYSPYVDLDDVKIYNRSLTQSEIIQSSLINL